MHENPKTRSCEGKSGFSFFKNDPLQAPLPGELAHKGEVMSDVGRPVRGTVKCRTNLQ